MLLRKPSAPMELHRSIRHRPATGSRMPEDRKISLRTRSAGIPEKQKGLSKLKMSFQTHDDIGFSG